MTDKRTTWVDGDVLNADDLSDSILANRWVDILRPIGTIERTFAFHSATNWSISDSDSKIRATADTGATTADKATGVGVGIMKSCAADTTNAYFIGTTSNITTDSGVTWAVTATAPTFGTSISDVSFPTTSLIVVSGDDGGGGKHIVFSTDSGATWTDATTPPSSAIVAVGMYDGTTGYAYNATGDFWKTTDGAVTWTDTTHSISDTIAAPAHLLAISATKVISTDNHLVVYDNSAGTVKSYGYYTIVSNLGGVILTSGEAVVCISTGSNLLFYRTTDGLSFKQLNVPLNATDPGNGKYGIYEYSANKLIYFHPGSKATCLLDIDD